MQAKEIKFKKRLKNVLDNENLDQQRDLIKRVTAELDLSLDECAAALVFLYQPNLYQKANNSEKKPETISDFEIPHSMTQNKTVRYRLEVGKKHQVKPEEIKKILVEESGVERNQIGQVDIRHHFTLVELPYGMPADIFQLLSDVEIRQQKLHIKRFKPQRKFRRYRKQAN